MAGHFCILGKEYKGPGESAFRVSHKTPIDCDSGESGAQVALRALSDMRDALPAAVKLDIPAAHVRMIAFWAGARLDRSEPESGARVTMSEVLRARKYLTRTGGVAVVSEVDKGPGEMSIHCPVVQWYFMHAAWPAEPHRFSVLPPDVTAWDVLRADIKMAQEKKWDRFMPLYGVDSEGYPGKCGIAVGYASPKRKFYKLAGPDLDATDIPVGKVKARPIAPYTKHPLKRICNKVATAAHYGLTVVSEAEQVRMWSCAEWPRRCRERLPAIMDRLPPGVEAADLAQVNQI